MSRCPCDITVITLVRGCTLHGPLTSCSPPRPIAGHANLCPSSVSTKPQELEILLSTVKHEMLHALGFSVSLFAFYRYGFALCNTASGATLFYTVTNSEALSLISKLNLILFVLTFQKILKFYRSLYSTPFHNPLLRRSLRTILSLQKNKVVT